MEVKEEKHKSREFLVETDWLEQNLNNENLRIFGCAVNAIVNPERIMDELRYLIASYKTEQGIGLGVAAWVVTATNP